MRAPDFLALGEKRGRFGATSLKDVRLAFFFEEKGDDVWGRDRYMLNPAVPSAERLRDFELMGAVLGVAIRSDVPLPLVLASTLLKGLVEMEKEERDRPVAWLAQYLDDYSDNN